MKHPIGNRCQRDGFRISQEMLFGVRDDGTLRLSGAPRRWVLVSFPAGKRSADQRQLCEKKCLRSGGGECIFVLTKGMSVVGPRPALPSEVVICTLCRRLCLLVKSGIACY